VSLLCHTWPASRRLLLEFVCSSCDGLLQTVLCARMKAKESQSLEASRTLQRHLNDVRQFELAFRDGTRVCVSDRCQPQPTITASISQAPHASSYCSGEGAPADQHNQAAAQPGDRLVRRGLWPAASKLSTFAHSLLHCRTRRPLRVYCACRTCPSTRR
jgi:hypothetical protein